MDLLKDSAVHIRNTTVLYMLSNDEGSGKLNAAISLAAFLTGQTNVAKFLVELAMQLSGALVAGVAVSHLVASPKGTCFAPATTNTSIFLWEMLGTFIIGVVFSTSGRKYRTTGPLAIGLSLFTAAPGPCAQMSHCTPSFEWCSTCSPCQSCRRQCPRRAGTARR
jgi:glycerol uptake facilitator-like aquaporin